MEESRRLYICGRDACSQAKSNWTAGAETADHGYWNNGLCVLFVKSFCSAKECVKIGTPRFLSAAGNDLRKEVNGACGTAGDHLGAAVKGTALNAIG